MDIKEQLRARLQLKEGAEVEYKSAKGGFPQSFWSSFSAFANTDGGTIVLGVKEKNGNFVPDSLTDEQVTAYRKKFWDDAHNKACSTCSMELATSFSYPQPFWQYLSSSPRRRLRLYR